MVELLYAEINVVGIILLSLFLTDLNRGSNKKTTYDQHLFNLCLVLNILVFVFDTGMWLIDGQQFTFARSLNYIVTTFYYILNPLICFAWLLYTDYKINENWKGLLKRIPYYVIPCAISAALSIVSVFTHWLFIIDASNVYMRGPSFWVMAVAALFYLALSLVLSLTDIITNGWEGNKNVFIHLFLFPVLIIVASIIQIMFYGISIIWVSAMVAFASIYINIQNNELFTDSLTGLNNRNHLDRYFNKRIKRLNKDRHLFAIMLDLDDFKKINDDLGHAVGDMALIEMANILRLECKRNDDLIVRVGGDEFFILGERSKPEEVLELVDAITASASRFNESNSNMYELKPSIGFSIFNQNDSKNSFFAKADHAMYLCKQERKKAKSKNN